jgi:peroxiredoxin 2/4
MDQEKPNMPLLGDPFPSITAMTTHGKKNIPGDYAGRWFVLFSHPADFTPVCTTEFIAFQQRKSEFDALGCDLIGLSVDQVFSHIKWTEWIREKMNVEIEFPIIAANDHIAYQLGMLHPGKGTNTVRAVFIVDDRGIVRLVMYYPQEVGRNMDEIVRSVRALQVSDREGAVPAGWPHNELIGDRIIVPPATDEQSAKSRLQDRTLECYDWWFCHKPKQS